MKKLILAIAILLFFFVLSIYLFFPATRTLQYSLTLGVPQKALQRALAHQSLATQTAGSDTTSDMQQAVLLRPGMYDGFVVSIAAGKDIHNSQLKLLALGADSTMAHWSAVVKGGNYPWQRLATWQQSRRIQNDMRDFMNSLQIWEQDETLYGFKVAYETVQDSVMMATRFTTPRYPSTADIYKHINLLQQYIAGEKALATNAPMLHVQPLAQGFEAMVAVPTSRLLPGKGAITLKRMVLGNILRAEIRGGQAKVEEGLQQLGNYVNDHGLISPAIPFASFITDRTKEPDSTKWITRIYYPIF